jgi:hypothetical protein
MVAASGTAHAAGIRTLRPRLAGRSPGYGWRYSPSIGPVAAPPVHILASAQFAFDATDSVCGSCASRPFSARAPPAV